ncbi:MAG: hypothetical protein JNM72_10385 [Deltaproteobacteria bacterium]|jgi:hypothetical protein|nr:hypothetical protein [Deltaproteobacteria bacterium]
MSETELANPATVASAQIAEHLTFLAYEVSQNGEAWFAQHSTQPNLRLRALGGGTLIASFFGLKGDPATAIRFANELNQKAVVARFLIDPDGDFAMEGWIAAPYDRAAFSAWMDTWQRDFGAVVNHPDAQNLLR